METSVSNILYQETNAAGATLRLRWIPGQRPYSTHIMATDKIILLELEFNGTVVNIAYSDKAPEHIWKALYDVFVLPPKKLWYLRRMKALLARLENELNIEEEQ